MVDFEPFDDYSMFNSVKYQPSSTRNEIIEIVNRLDQEDLYYLLEILKSTMRVEE